jgi:phosphatidylglycerol:prolipoprotein diacylglycerol transferase
MNSTISQLPPQSVWIGVGLMVAATLAVGLAAVQARLGQASRAPQRMTWATVGDLVAVFGGCVIVGGLTSRLFWMLLEPSVDFVQLWRHPWSTFDPRQGGHSSFGALVGASLVVGLWLRASVSGARGRQALAGLDALAAGGLAGLALARLGCLANGCDFGKPTDLAWAVRHGPRTDAFRAHLERGWIGIDAVLSAPVHPFALYLVVGTLAIVAWAVWAIVRRRFAPGRVAVWAAGVYLSWRFVAEWTRDEATVLMIAAGLNIHHLIAAVGLGVLGVAMLWLDACDKKEAESSSARVVQSTSRQ